MDVIDAFIVNCHRLLGHDKAADFMGVPRGDKSQCRLCRGEDPQLVFAKIPENDQPAQVIPIRPADCNRSPGPSPERC